MGWRIGGILLLLAGFCASVVAAAQEIGPLRIELDAARGELVLDYGPLDLPAGASHHAVQQLGALAGVVPVSGWLHGFRVEVADREGRHVPREVLHHVNLIAMDRRELFSPIMRRIGAAGHETEPVRLPRMLGYPIRRGERVLVTAMLHNPTETAYEGVSVRMRLPFTAADTWLPPMPVYPFYLDVMPPASKHAYDLPPGRSEKSWEGRPAVSGRILGLGGHLHRYGVELRLEDVTRGKVIWEAKPWLDGDGEVVGMPTRTFYWRLGIPLRKDRVYRLTAVYENPTGRAIPDGAMGALGGIIVTGRDAGWPAADTANPDYRLDIQLVSDATYGGMSGGPVGNGHSGHR